MSYTPTSYGTPTQSIIVATLADHLVLPTSGITTVPVMIDLNSRTHDGSFALESMVIFGTTPISNSIQLNYALCSDILDPNDVPIFLSQVTTSSVIVVDGETSTTRYYNESIFILTGRYLYFWITSPALEVDSSLILTTKLIGVKLDQAE